jgi:hypothetical protein
MLLPSTAAHTLARGPQSEDAKNLRPARFVNFGLKVIELRPVLIRKGFGEIHER